MAYNILLCGVGGQGTVLASKLLAATAGGAGLKVHSAETIGMAQRGGPVTSHVRIGEDAYSPLIPQGSADVVISMEPMEALRYLPYLAKTGTIVTSSKPFINIPNYPDEAALMAELDSMPSVVKLDIESVAKDAGNVRGANMVLLGMAAPFIEILTVEQLRKAISVIFARKGEAIVEANLKAFDMGVEASKK